MLTELLVTWTFADERRVKLFVDSRPPLHVPDFKAHVYDQLGFEEARIAGSDIVGLPFDMPRELLDNPKLLVECFKQTWVKLVQLSDNSYRLYFNYKGLGGGWASNLLRAGGALSGAATYCVVGFGSVMLVAGAVVSLPVTAPALLVTAATTGGGIASGLAGLYAGAAVVESFDNAADKIDENEKAAQKLAEVEVAKKASDERAAQERRQHKRQYTTLKAETQKAHNLWQESNAKVESFSAKLARKNSKHQEEVGRFEAREREMQTQVSGLGEESRKLREELAKLSTDNQETVTKLKESIARLEGKIRALEAMLQRERQELDSRYQQTITNLKTQLAKACDERDGLSKALAEINSKLEAQKKIINGEASSQGDEPTSDTPKPTSGSSGSQPKPPLATSPSVVSPSRGDKSDTLPASKPPSSASSSSPSFFSSTSSSAAASSSERKTDKTGADSHRSSMFQVRPPADSRLSRKPASGPGPAPGHVMY